METTTNHKRGLRKNQRGLSNIIIVALSLVIIVAIISNVVLWSYQMTQLDWEKMQENLSLTNVSRATRSSWFTAQSEYKINQGVRTSGSYLDTQEVDNSYESFRESPPPRLFDINGTFFVDMVNYPLAYIQTIEIQLRYRVDDTGEKWFLRAYDWTSQTYTDSGFNSTAGSVPSASWNNYTVNLTSKWGNYVRSDGRMFIKVQDQGPDSTRTNIDIDFLAARAVLNGAVFTFQNRSSKTAHVVSIWINNSTQHRRYDADTFVNSGETLSYGRWDISLPNGQYVAKIVTERGNIAVYTGG